MEHEPAPSRYVRPLDPDEVARLLDGAPHAEPEVVRRQRDFSPHAKLDRAVAWWSILIASATFWYFFAQLVRGALS